MTNQPIADVTEIPTRQTKDGFELKCPKCGQWRRELLATEQGTMCPSCWKLRKDEGTPGAG